MSVKVMSYVWDISLFKGSDKLIMLCLADHADDAGVCWPSIETIARKSGVSPTTVKATLKKLEAGGLDCETKPVQESRFRSISPFQ